MKILGSVTPVDITADVAASLKLKDGFSLIALPNEVLEKHGVKSFDVLESSDNELMLVAQNKQSELTNEDNKPPTKEIVS